MQAILSMEIVEMASTADLYTSSSIKLISSEF